MKHAVKNIHFVGIGGAGMSGKPSSTIASGSMKATLKLSAQSPGVAPLCA